MGSIVVSEFITLDGVFQDPGGTGEIERGGWSFRSSDTEGQQFKLNELAAAGALLLGRVTYLGFAAAWPSMHDSAGFAGKMNSMPKYVVSTTLDELTWNNSTLIKGNVAEQVSRLKQEVDGDILIFGSGQVAETLRAHDLIDEYRLMVYPIVVGSGKRLFGDGSTPTTLDLVEARPLSSGIVILTYRPHR